MHKLDELRVRSQARNEQLLKRVHETLESNYQNESLLRSKESLEEAKKQFLRDLNRRDPMWREKMRTRKLEEIRRLEMAKEKL